MADLDTDPLTRVPVWPCPYCGHLVDVAEDANRQAIDHMLDEHRAELIAERPRIIRR